MTDEFIVIDDKPGTNAYRSNIHQVYGYCLAFKEIPELRDDRPVLAALRERGTENIYWTALFNKDAEVEIANIVNHIHGLLDGAEEFSSSDNPNKCRACRFNKVCERVISQ